jgi:hypothetical protein
MSGAPGPLERLYYLLLRAYPPEYIQTFGDEMHDTFIDGLQEAKVQGAAGLFIVREIRDLPKSLWNAYWYGWKNKLLGGIQTLQTVMSFSDLPPAPPDGRDSWWEALREIALFLITGSLLILATYFQPEGLPAGWQRNFEFLGDILITIAVPFFLLGLVRGLPRWSYPFGGLLLGYYGIFAGQNSLWLFLFLMVIATLALAIAAILADPQPSLMPVFIRRVGQSLSVDWTRLSFGLYGAAPLLILMAFDDSHLNSRTPYLGLSVMAMTVGALLYCRSRAVSTQISALLLGITLSIWGAGLDRISFAEGLVNWVRISSPGKAVDLWLLKLWAQWMILTLSPAVPVTLARGAKLKQAV